MLPPPPPVHTTQTPWMLLFSLVPQRATCTRVDCVLSTETVLTLTLPSHCPRSPFVFCRKSMTSPFPARSYLSESPRGPSLPSSQCSWLLPVTHTHACAARVIGACPTQHTCRGPGRVSPASPPLRGGRRCVWACGWSCLQGLAVKSWGASSRRSPFPSLFTTTASLPGSKDSG